MQCGYCINTASLKSPDDGFDKTGLGERWGRGESKAGWVETVAREATGPGATSTIAPQGGTLATKADIAADIWAKPRDWHARQVHDRGHNVDEFDQ